MYNKLWAHTKCDKSTASFSASLSCGIMARQKETYWWCKRMKKIIVSQKIKEFRRENGLTQEDFGKRLGVSGQAISKWEREECYPDITFLPSLADTLGCTVNDFFA